MISQDTEVLAVGAGPANLALAVALEELAPEVAARTLMIDRSRTVEWQTGLLLPWAKSQVSFLKDLVTLRNPRSRFSFLSYLHATGRLDDFINMGAWTAYRSEIAGYLNWSAGQLRAVGVQLGRECVAVEPQRDSRGTLAGWLASFADGSQVACRYLVLGIGRDPLVPAVFAGLPPHRVIHSTWFRRGLAGLPAGQRYRITVVGGSQSSAEMVLALRGALPGSEVIWIMRGIGLSADSSSKFTNELYYPSFVDSFYAAPAEARARIFGQMRRTNYSVLAPATLQALYQAHYLSRIGGQDPVRFLTMADITGAREEGGSVVLEVADRKTGTTSTVSSDVVFLGTGFDTRMPALVRGLARATGLHRIEVTRHYRLNLGEPAAAACYLQGVNEATHGIADSLLSILARRAAEVTLDLLAHRDRQPDPVSAARLD